MKKQASNINLNSVDLTALRDIQVGLAMFVPARQSDFLNSKGLVVRRPDGRVVLTRLGLAHIEGQRKMAPEKH